MVRPGVYDETLTLVRSLLPLVAIGYLFREASKMTANRAPPVCLRRDYRLQTNSQSMNGIFSLTYIQYLKNHSSNKYRVHNPDC